MSSSFDGRLASSFSSIPPQPSSAPYANMTNTQTSPPHPSSHLQRASQSFGPINGHTNRPSHSANGPQIYTAVYSGVAVYEMEVGGVAVMRRRSDSWLNSTQILKVAAVDKGKRTKILEKEIHTGHHEKVQGGYGRYQGTWISYERGRQFCRQYGVEEVLRPLLEYDLVNDGTGNKSALDTPTKEQAIAANRKRFYNAGVDNKVNGAFQSGTFFQGISPTASTAIAAMNKAARYDSPAVRQGNAQRKALGLARQPSQQMDSQGSGLPASQSSQHSFVGDHSMELNSNAHASQQYADYNNDILEPPRKRLRPESSQDMHMMDPALQEETPTEVNESFVQSQPIDMDGSQATLPPMQMSTDTATEEKRQALLALFEDTSRTNITSHPALQQLSGRDLDIPLDTTANTALHWAATLARVSVMKALIAKGANMYQGNAGNQTALMAAVQVNNCFDFGSFPEILEILGPLIEVRDATGRTVLHHIAVSSGIKGRAQSSRYYLESLLEFTVRQGSNPNSQQQSLTNGVSASQKKTMNLGRFMSEVVNVQDKSGNTALNIVARIGNRPIINQLEEVGADFEAANHTGFRPADFGVFPRSSTQNQLLQEKNNPSSQESVPTSQVDQIRGEIFATTNSILAQTQEQYQAELSKKQEIINIQNSELRNIAAEYEDERVRLDESQRRAKEHAERQQKIANHRRHNDERRTRLELKNAEAEGVESLEDLNVDRFSLPIKTEEDIERIKGMLDEEAAEKLKLLPAKGELEARLKSYRGQNQQLQTLLGSLRERSSELEGKYRKVVSMCTGTPEAEVDGMLGQLLAALTSEESRDTDMGRVREFLRKVDGAEA